tara:strand:+ start:259 stop:450 length:192 start_codon:yes stop_codon:yes gene_type:complete
MSLIIIIHRLHVKKIASNQQMHKRWLIDITSKMNIDEQKNDEIFYTLLKNQSDFNDILEEQFS